MEGKSADFISSLKTVDKTVNITWYKNNVVINESSDVKISFDGTVARLSITRCKVTHSATYKIVARNEFGEDESVATLVVNEKKEEEQVIFNFTIHFFYFTHKLHTRIMTHYITQFLPHEEGRRK